MGPYGSALKRASFTPVHADGHASSCSTTTCKSKRNLIQAGLWGFRFRIDMEVPDANTRDNHRLWGLGFRVLGLTLLGALGIRIQG